MKFGPREPAPVSSAVREMRIDIFDVNLTLARPMKLIFTSTEKIHVMVHMSRDVHIYGLHYILQAHGMFSVGSRGTE
ncbi:hypothetical protein CRUP_023223 [Coryphaenoides rupestris]|nr:hypothetical protein CRUP_023223 [Coryphaenoides rupestris]